MKVVGLVSLLGFSFAACVAQAGVACAELKTGWRFVGGWPNGYMHWRVDLTPYLVEGRNVIAVRTFRPQGYARWHTGLGLTRRCRLVALPEDYVVPDSVCITTPEVTRERTTVRVTYDLARGEYQLDNFGKMDSNEPIVVEASGSGLSGTCSF